MPGVRQRTRPSRNHPRRRHAPGLRPRGPSGRARTGHGADAPHRSWSGSLGPYFPFRAGTWAAEIGLGAVTGDLLWLTNATVAVSSHVDYPRDIPNQIADHNFDTAWNGKTGDLVGAWIMFCVPRDAMVLHVMLTVGFDKKTAKEDLFTANHRISKVRVSRFDTVLRESVDLDPNNRAPQKTDINAKGGDYKIEVLAVVPGAHAGWKEIAVSEIQVIGTASTVRLTDEGPPAVHVGGLDVVEEPFADVRGESYAVACERVLQNEKQAWKISPC